MAQVVGDLVIRMAADVARVKSDMDSVKSYTKQTADVADKAALLIKQAFAAISVGFVVREFVQLSDAATSLDARLKLATRSSQEYETAQKDVYRIAQSMRVPLADIATLYGRLSDPVRKLGGDTRATAIITEGFAAALRISGATTAEASSATLQFSQAMASGVLRGEEFNAVNEASPRVMQALESALGKTRGELRKMAEQGQLTADVVGNALIKEFVNLKAEAESMPITFGAAMTQLRNDILVFVAGVESATGVSQSLSGFIQSIAILVNQFGSALFEAGKNAADAGHKIDYVGGAILGIGTIIETLLVLGAQVSYVFKAIGIEIGGLAAQAVALASNGLEAAKEVGHQMKEDAAANRAEIDRFTASIIGSTQKSLAQRDALKSVSLSMSENVSELSKLMRQGTSTNSVLQANTAATISTAEANKKAAAAAKEAAKQEKEHADAVNRMANATSAKTAVTEESVAALDFGTPVNLQAIGIALDQAKSADSAAAAFSRLTHAWDKDAQAAKEWNDTVSQVEKSLTDSLMRAFESGKSFADAFKDTLVNTFKTLVLKPIIESITKPMSDAIADVFKAAASGSGSIADALSKFGDAFGNSIAQKINKLGEFLQSSNNQTVNSAGSWLSSNSGTLGKIGAAIPAYEFGQKLKSSISGGYEVSSGMSTFQDIGVAVGSYINPVLGALIGASAGVFNRLFGRKLQDTGIEGALSTAGLTGNAYEFYKGGVFRSNKTKRSDLDPAVNQVFLAGVTAATQSVQAYADALGLPIQAIEGYTEQIKISFKGLSEEEIQQAIVDAITKYQAGLASLYSGALAQYQRAGETTLETLQRLAQLETFSRTMNSFGGVFSRLATLGIDARESLIAMAGGMDALMQKTGQFVSLYYTEQEQASLAARNLLTALQESANWGTPGDIANLSTIQQYRALLESQTLTNDWSKERFTALLDNASAFAEVARYLAENGGTLATLAAQAPQSSALDTIFGPATTADGTAAGLQLGLSDVSSAVTAGAESTIEVLNRLTGEVVLLRTDINGGLAAVAGNTQKSSDYLRDLYEDYQFNPGGA
jgi:tape measure domain-containing protein